MIKRWIILDLIGWCVLALFIYLLPSCTPQKRLDRLVKNNPELVKRDTVKITRVVEVPGVKIDTATNTNTDLTGLLDILKVYKNHIDSLTLFMLTNDLKDYTINRHVINDTFKIPLPNNGLAKIYQSNGKLRYNLNIPPKKYTFILPVVVNNITTTTKITWLYFWLGLSVVPVLIVLIVVVIKALKS